MRFDTLEPGIGNDVLSIGVNVVVIMEETLHLLNQPGHNTFVQ
jgi:hypothetical protein